MKKVLLSTAAWPNLHYLFYIVNSEGVVIEQHETYPRQTFRNRYEILSANGVLPLTIPVKRSGNHTKTKDILIDYSSDWQTQHWRALTSAYRKSPFFEFFEEDLKPLFENHTDLLLDYNLSQLILITKLLRIKPLVSRSAQFERDAQLLLDKRMISGPQYEFKNDTGVSEILSAEYYQTFGGKFPFAPNLSVLDILFNLGLKAMDYLKKGPIS